MHLELYKPTIAFCIIRSLERLAQHTVQGQELDTISFQDAVKLYEQWKIHYPIALQVLKLLGVPKDELEKFKSEHLNGVVEIIEHRIKQNKMYLNFKPI